MLRLADPIPGPPRRRSIAAAGSSSPNPSCPMSARSACPRRRRLQKGRWTKGVAKRSRSSLVSAGWLATKAGRGERSRTSGCRVSREMFVESHPAGAGASAASRRPPLVGSRRREQIQRQAQGVVTERSGKGNGMPFPFAVVQGSTRSKYPTERSVVVGRGGGQCVRPRLDPVTGMQEPKRYARQDHGGVRRRAHGANEIPVRADRCHRVCNACVHRCTNEQRGALGHPRRRSFTINDGPAGASARSRWAA